MLLLYSGDLLDLPTKKVITKDATNPSIIVNVP